MVTFKKRSNLENTKVFNLFENNCDLRNQTFRFAFYVGYNSVELKLLK